MERITDSTIIIQMANMKIGCLEIALILSGLLILLLTNDYTKNKINKLNEKYNQKRINLCYFLLTNLLEIIFMYILYNIASKIQVFSNLKLTDLLFLAVLFGIKSGDNFEHKAIKNIMIITCLFIPTLIQILIIPVGVPVLIVKIKKLIKGENNKEYKEQINA